jgi:hypothetical protein
MGKKVHICEHFLATSWQIFTYREIHSQGRVSTLSDRMAASVRDSRSSEIPGDEDRIFKQIYQATAMAAVSKKG